MTYATYPGSAPHHPQPRSGIQANEVTKSNVSWARCFLHSHISGLKRPGFWGKEEARKIRKWQRQPRDRKGSHCERSAKMISLVTTAGKEKGLVCISNKGKRNHCFVWAGLAGYWILNSLLYPLARIQLVSYFFLSNPEMDYSLWTKMLYTQPKTQTALKTFTAQQPILNRSCPWPF